MKKSIWKIAPAALAFCADQAAKALARVRLPQAGRVVLLPDALALRYAENTGAAFSFLRGSPALLVALTALLLGGVAIWLFLDKKISAQCAVGLSLILGGGLGNLADRALFGHVTDFIEVLFMRFAIFNLADCAICLGAFLAAVSLCRKEKP